MVDAANHPPRPRALAVIPEQIPDRLKALHGFQGENVKFCTLGHSERYR
jgi:hypothetical protein